MTEIDIETVTLLNGSHAERKQGLCLMEAVAYVAGEPHSDHPKCADVALAAYGRRLNDDLKDDDRQLLRPLIKRLVGTRGSDDLMRRRVFLLVDRYLRLDLPAFFRELPNKPRPDFAERLESISPVVDFKSAEAARIMILEIRSAAYASAAAYAYAAADAAADASADAYASASAYAAVAAAAAADAATYAYAAYAAADAATYAYAAYAAYATADADAAAYAYAYADAYADADAAAVAVAAASAYAYATADAAYAAYAASASAASAAAYADADAALRKRTIARAIATFESAIDLTESE